MTPPGAAIDTPTLRLLVVEDEALVAMLVEDALALHGHTVVGIAESAGQAIELATRERPDMVLCDIRLTDGYTGTEVAQTLAGGGTPVLYLSANCPPASAHPLIVGCLPKPFHTAAIGRAVLAAHAAVNGRTPADLPAGMWLYGG